MKFESLPILEFEGPLKQNYLLNNAQLLFQNELFGPESLALAPNGSFFTGTFGGHIWRIDGENKKKIATIQNGRPLGIRIDSKGNLYVIEANSGLYQINSKLNVKKILDMSGNGAKSFIPSKFIDDLVVDEGSGTDGGDVIYFTDVSTKFTLENSFYVIYEPDSTGRIIKYDINANQLTVLLDGLWLPNGIELNDDKTAIIFCEFTKRRIIKHYIRGPNKGTTQVLIEGLTGEPDNIRRSKSKVETYWVAMAMARNSSNPTILDKISSYPSIRKVVLRTLYLLGSILNFVGQVSNYEPFAEFGHSLKTGHYILLRELSRYPGMVVEIDSKGNIITSLQSPNNKVSSLSEVLEISNTPKERVLYLGSYSNPYVGKLILKN